MSPSVVATGTPESEIFTHAGGPTLRFPTWVSILHAFAFKVLDQNITVPTGFLVMSFSKISAARKVDGGSRIKEQGNRAARESFSVCVIFIPAHIN
jgi:hypothetical protein